MSKKYKFLTMMMIFITSFSSVYSISIDKLKSDPLKYNQSIVRLKGDISNYTKIPFCDLSLYKISDKSGTLLVFTAFPKENGQRISIKAEVVSYDGRENEKSREESITRISDYLLENEIFDQEGAKRFASITLNFINSITDSLSGVWFVIEQEKRGFFHI